MKSKVTFVTSVWFLAIFHSATVFAQLASIAPNEQPLFSKFETLSFRLEAPFEQLFSKRYPSREAKKMKIAGHLFYQEQDIPVQIRMRGFSSLSNCSFPKLTLELDQNSAQGTVFANIKKVDLGTHCNATGGTGTIAAFDGMRFNHREVLIYRWLQILGIPSYAVRPARVTYKDNSRSDHTEIQEDAFLLEHLSSLVKRAHAIEIRAQADNTHTHEVENNSRYKKNYTKLADHPQIDRKQVARITFFESLIGNWDFHLDPDLIWNFKILELPNGVWFPIPMDFNLSFLASGQAVTHMNEVPHYDLVDSEIVAEMTALLQSKRTELYESLSLLTNDPAGLAAFKNTLDTMVKPL